VQAFDLNISLSACYIVGGAICWLLMPRLGRATLYMGGMTFMFFCLVAIGGLGFDNSQKSQLAIGILLVISTLANMTTIGPVCYPIVAETPSGRLRYKTITIGRFVYNVTGIFNNSVTPRMISATGKSLQLQVCLQYNMSNSLILLVRIQLGTGAPKLVYSMPVPTFCATSGAGFACLRRKAAPLGRLI
jgi:MFS transporter, SP family, general alpha glucoside:H+ symporter